MYLMRRLTDNDMRKPLRIMREMSYAVGEDFCMGYWPSGGQPSVYNPPGGYQCTGTGRCKPATGWKSMDQMSKVYWENIGAGYNSQVQFCQCWVYATVVTTFSRGLGLVTRSVTNFASMHDKGDFDKGNTKVYINGLFAPKEKLSTFCSNTCLGYMVNKIGFGGCPSSCWSKTWSARQCAEGPKCSQCAACIAKDSASVWNFHVWNEGYARGPTKAGFFAFDATPQESSEGRMQMGPANLEWMHDNNVQCKDEAFIQSEVHPQERQILLYTAQPSVNSNCKNPIYTAQGYWMCTTNGDPYYKERGMTSNGLTATETMSVTLSSTRVNVAWLYWDYAKRSETTFQPVNHVTMRKPRCREVYGTPSAGNPASIHNADDLGNTGGGSLLQTPTGGCDVFADQKDVLGVEFAVQNIFG